MRSGWMVSNFLPLLKDYTVGVIRYMDRPYNRWFRVSYIVLILIFSFFNTELSPAHVRFGVVGGLNYADLSLDIHPAGDDYSNDVTSIAAYAVGGMIEFHLEHLLAIRIQPMIVRNGGTPASPFPGVALRFLSSYIEIPVLLRASYGESIRPYVLAGLFAGLMVDSQIEASGFGLSIANDMESLTKRLNAGVVFGAGVAFPAGLARLFIEATFGVGFTDIVKEGVFSIETGVEDVTEWITEDDVEMKTRGLRIMGGVTLPLTM